MMECFARCDADGVVLWTASGPEGSAAAQQPADGHSIEFCGADVKKGWIKRGNTFAPPIEPVRTLAARRVARRREAQTYRTEKVTGGCMTPLGRVQTDETSQASILQAMFRAQMALSTGEPLVIIWLMEDNTAVAHDAAALIEMGLAVGAFKTACFNTSFAIMDDIALADDPESIDITAGYPPA
jgi:hypothetical protein